MAVDPQQLRAIMGRFATGVTVVTLPLAPLPYSAGNVAQTEIGLGEEDRTAPASATKNGLAYDEDALPAEEVEGITVNSLTSVSLQPPLVLICIEQRHRFHRLLLDRRRFAVNFVSAEQEAISRYYAHQQGGFVPADAFVRGPNELPILKDGLGWLAARTSAVYPGGDHSIFVAEVTSLDVTAHGGPLLFYQGRYSSLASPPL